MHLYRYTILAIPDFMELHCTNIQRETTVRIAKQFALQKIKQQVTDNMMDVEVSSRTVAQLVDEVVSTKLKEHTAATRTSTSARQKPQGASTKPKGNNVSSQKKRTGKPKGNASAGQKPGTSKPKTATQKPIGMQDSTRNHNRNPTKTTVAPKAHHSKRAKGNKATSIRK